MGAPFFPYSSLFRFFFSPTPGLCGMHSSPPGRITVPTAPITHARRLYPVLTTARPPPAHTHRYQQAQAQAPRGGGGGGGGGGMHDSSSGRKRTPKACRFFASAKGCRNGDGCKFSHDDASGGGGNTGGRRDPFFHRSMHMFAPREKTPRGKTNRRGVLAAVQRRNDCYPRNAETIVTPFAVGS